jgi:hypothetical protein
MNYIAKVLAAAVFFSLFTATSSFCQEASIAQLVDKYTKDTDLQKMGVVKEYLGRKIAVSGAVNNVGEENTFDVVNDVERHYYKVILDVANTPAGNPYRAVLIYKNMDKVKNIVKGQSVVFSGEIIRVSDDKLYLSVWLSADKLTDQERELFK